MEIGETIPWEKASFEAMGRPAREISLRPRRARLRITWPSRKEGRRPQPSRMYDPKTLRHFELLADGVTTQSPIPRSPNDSVHSNPAPGAFRCSKMTTMIESGDDVECSALPWTLNEILMGSAEGYR